MHGPGSMPELNGVEATRRLKGDRDLTSPPSVVMVTAYGQEEVRTSAAKAGADGFLSKSHGIDKLGDMVDEMVDSILW